MSSARGVAVLPCAHVRSTLLVGSLRALRSCGHGDAYGRAVHPEVLTAISAVAIPQWLPIAVAQGHYAACDALGLSVDEMLRIGALVAPTAASGVQVVLRAARTGGATPWTALDRAPTYWGRMYDGSSLAVTKTGPKDAVITVRRNTLARFAYWRIGLRGIILGLAKALASTAIARELEHQALGHDSVSYALSWV